VVGRLLARLPAQWQGSVLGTLRQGKFVWAVAAEIHCRRHRCNGGCCSRRPGGPALSATAGGRAVAHVGR